MTCLYYLFTTIVFTIHYIYTIIFFLYSLLVTYLNLRLQDQ